MEKQKKKNPSDYTSKSADSPRMGGDRGKNAFASAGIKMEVSDSSPLICKLF